MIHADLTFVIYYVDVIAKYEWNALIQSWGFENLFFYTVIIQNWKKPQIWDLELYVQVCAYQV